MSLCASIMAANPRLLIHDTPMVALSRFSGSMVVGCLKEVKGAARQKHNFSIVESGMTPDEKADAPESMISGPATPQHAQIEPNRLFPNYYPRTTPTGP